MRMEELVQCGQVMRKPAPCLQETNDRHLSQAFQRRNDHASKYLGRRDTIRDHHRLLAASEL